MPLIQEMKISLIVLLSILTVCTNKKINLEHSLNDKYYESKFGYNASINSAFTENVLIKKINKIKNIPFRTIKWNKKEIDSIVWNCGDSIYWEIVQLGEEAIPHLISIIQDTTKTDIKIPCQEGNLTIGTVAFMILDDIISIPYFSVFGIRWDVFEMNCNFGYPIGLLEYINTYPQTVNKKLTEWYDKYGNKIKNKKLQSTEQNDCQKAFGIDYKLRVKY